MEQKPFMRSIFSVLQKPLPVSCTLLLCSQELTTGVCPTTIHATTFHPLSLRSILILSSHLYLCLKYSLPFRFVCMLPCAELTPVLMSPPFVSYFPYNGWFSLGTFLTLSAKWTVAISCRMMVF